MKSWQEKMNPPGLPKIVKVPAAWAAKIGKGTMLIAHPREVDGLIRKVRRGKLITVNQIRERLAKKHRAGST